MAASCAAWLPVCAVAADGDPDPAFGYQGASYLGWSFPPSTDTLDMAYVALPIADGRVVLVGQINTPNGNRIGVSRVTSAGSFDGTFGDLSTAGQHIVGFSGSGSEHPVVFDAMFDRDQNIVIAGCIIGSGDSDMAVWRLAFDGNDDLSFAQGGQFRIDRGVAGAADCARTIAERSTGPSSSEYLAAGYVSGGGGFLRPAAFVVGSDGSLVDRGATQLLNGPFSGKHFYQMNFPVACAPAVAVGTGEITDVVVGAGNAIVATGEVSCGAPAQLFAFATKLDSSTGEPSVAFGSNGYARVTYGDPAADWDSYGGRLSLDAEGRIVMVGLSLFRATALRRIGVARMTSSGVLDPAFAGTGKTIVFVHACGGTCDVNALRGVAVERDGDIFALADIIYPTMQGAKHYPTLARLRPNGARNTSFVDTVIGDPGVRAYPFPFESHSQIAMALTRDIDNNDKRDRLVVAGYVVDGGSFPGNEYFAVRKLLDDGIFAENLEAP